MKKPTHITCRCWFQRTYGNTYFSAVVFFDNGEQAKIISYEYGYGDHCLDAALDWLGANDFVTLPPKYSNGMRSHSTTIFLREELKCTYEIIDVERKKDL